MKFSPGDFVSITNGAPYPHTIALFKSADSCTDFELYDDIDTIIHVRCRTIAVFLGEVESQPGKECCSLLVNNQKLYVKPTFLEPYVERRI